MISNFTARQLLFWTRKYREQLAFKIGAGLDYSQNSARELVALDELLERAAQQDVGEVVPPGMHDRNGNTR